MSGLTGLQYLQEMRDLCCLQSMEGERVGKASNSELRRWLKAGHLEVNYSAIDADEPMPPFLKSVVLFPKNKRRRSTLYFDAKVHFLQIEPLATAPQGD